MIMANGWVYIGKFSNDKPEDESGRLLMSNSIIYEGRFVKGKTSPIGMLLYPNGDIYYGQISMFQKDGYGKLIKISGGFMEGFWESEKFTGNN
jgi:hypothetical protein